MLLKLMNLYVISADVLVVTAVTIWLVADLRRSDTKDDESREKTRL